MNVLTITGRAFLARSSKQVDAQLFITATTTRLQDETGEDLFEFTTAELRFDAPLGRADKRATLPDGTLFETSDHAAVAQLPGHEFAKALDNAEQFRPRLFLVILAAIAGIFAIWKYALPALVWFAVALTPDPLRDVIDAGSVQAVDATFAEPTRLTLARQAEIRTIFNNLIAQLPEKNRSDGFQLEFRDIPGIGPNAAALPGGTIVITDALATGFDDDVIAAVLGHELGHVVEDHGLTQLYRSLGIYVLVALIAGDTGPILEDILLEGGVILSLSFSREHEASADQFGLRISDDAGYDPAGLMAFFEALPDANDTDTGWASTHPASGARIEAIKEYLDAR